MRTVVCIGGGRFGTRAAAEARDQGARVLVVDTDEHCRARSIATTVTDDPDYILGALEGEVLFLQGDGPKVLLDILDRWLPDVVVPAARGHLAALVAVEHCRRLGRRLVPASDRVAELSDMLPHHTVRLSDTDNGVIVTSFMEHGRCPDVCDQPACCPVTGLENPTPMHKLIEKALERSVDRYAVLVTSGTGNVGGVTGLDLGSLLPRLEQSQKGMVWGIATSCRCHGIINLLRIE